MNKQVLTREGLENLKLELKDRVENKRPEILVQLKEARAQGDLSENAEYDAAREAQARNESRITELEEIIKNAVILDDENHKSNAGKYITIVFDDTKQQLEFLLVSSSLEANPMEGKISTESPLGKAVYEANIGANVTVKNESGDEFTVTVKSIRKNK